MSINWDINVGTVAPVVIAIAGGLAGIFRRMSAMELTTTQRHAENAGKFNAIEASHTDIKGSVQRLSDTQQECQRKITETREMVIRLDEANKQRS